MRFLFFRYMAVPLVWVVAVFFLYSIPGEDLVYDDPWRLLRTDKLGHMAVFAMLCISLTVALRKQTEMPWLRQRPRAAALVFCIVYGGVLEILQGACFQSRTTDLLDFAANSIGALCGLLLFRLVYGARWMSS